MSCSQCNDMLTYWNKLSQHNIFGYNSSKYDLPVLMPFIVSWAKKNNQQIKVLKRGSAYICLQIGDMIFKGLSLIS